MSTKIRDSLMQSLCHDLDNEELERLMLTIKEKIEKGYNVEQIAQQLMTAISQVVLLAAPDLEDSEIVSISEDIGDALIDRVLDYAGYPVDTKKEEVPPREQLN